MVHLVGSVGTEEGSKVGGYWWVLR